MTRVYSQSVCENAGMLVHAWNPGAREAGGEGLSPASLGQQETLPQRKWTVFLKITPNAVLWPPNTPAHMFMGTCTTFAPAHTQNKIL